MDPLSITASIVTLYGALWQLRRMRRHYRAADAILGKIQGDCEGILHILRHFNDLLRQRRELLRPEDRFNSVCLDISLDNNCHELIRRVNALLDELVGLSTPPETRGELLWANLRRFMSLPRLQQAHAAIRGTFRDLEEQKTWLDSHNILIIIRRTSVPGTSPTAEQGSGNTSAGTLAITPVRDPPVLGPEVRELRARLLLDAIHANDNYSVQRILIDTGVDPNDSFPLTGGSLPLIVAISAGNLNIVELLLQYGADTSSGDSEGLTPLHVASMNDNGDMIDLLLQRGADPLIRDNGGRTPLWCAANGEYTNRSFRQLLDNSNHDTINERCDDRLPTPFWAAAAGGFLDRAIALLEKGADIGIRDSKQRTLLHRAEWSIAGTLTELLLNSGADPWARDDDEKLPLHWAAEKGRMDVAAKLLDRMIGQDSRSQADVANVPDDHGMTPLMYAALNGSLPLVMHIIRAWGAAFDLSDRLGNDAFYYACAKGHIQVAIFLLGSGAALNRGNNDQDTPLHTAASHGHSEMVKCLLQLGANPEARSERSIQNPWTAHDTQRSRESPQPATPAEVAVRAGHGETAELINDFKQH